VFARIMRIRPSAIDDMVSHARQESPNECCGLLIGEALEITGVERARNLRSSPVRFLIDPEAHFAAIRRARAEGVAVIGAYHSHPDSAARPSATDRAEVSYPEFLYVIVSLGDDWTAPEVRAYRLVEGNFEPVELVVLG
jgi:proteasome lid subunit RPN8/RPN11